MSADEPLTGLFHPRSGDILLSPPYGGQNGGRKCLDLSVQRPTLIFVSSKPDVRNAIDSPQSRVAVAAPNSPQCGRRPTLREGPSSPRGLRRCLHGCSPRPALTTPSGHARAVQPFLPRDPRVPPAPPAAVGGLVEVSSAAPAEPPTTGRERVFATAVRSALGVLAVAAADPLATDVFLAPEGTVWSDRGAGAERVPGLRLEPAAARELAVGLISAGGRHVDEATPCADVRLGEGLRVHVALPPISWAGTAISVRLPRVQRVTLRASGLDDPTIETLSTALADRRTVLFTGATGSGKTTLLAAWLSEAAASDRIVVIEDVAEAPLAHPHVVALECRQPNMEGAGEVDLARLVREALRMRPDRLVVGECRGAEIREFLAALNTGHRGGAGTLHANSLADVAARLEAVGMIAGLSPEALARQAMSGIDLVVHLERERDGARRASLGRFSLDDRERLAVVGLS